MISFFVLVSLAFLLTYFFDRYRTTPNLLLKGLALMMMKVNPGWNFHINNADDNKIKEPTIVVANHQSFLDMPLSYLLPWRMKWVAKKSLFRIPILGWIIAMTGHIAIDRHSLRSVKLLDKLVEPIKEGIPGMIFPEGTRTEDGELQSFKSGAFVLARQYNFKVLPVVLDGGYDAMPAGSWRVSPKQQFSISVLEPLNPNDFASAEELKAGASRAIEKELNRIRNTNKRAPQTDTH